MSAEIVALVVLGGGVVAAVAFTVVVVVMVDRLDANDAKARRPKGEDGA